MKKKPSARILLLSLLATALIPGQISAQTAADYNRMGVQAGQEKKYDTAVDLFNKSVQEYDRASASTFHNLGWSYEQLGQTDQAITFYEEAVRRNPDLVHSLERLGFLQYRKGLYYKSIIAGERVLELDPRIPMY
jgi:tetratricopeptide (TPR) repeat protein